MNQLLTRLTNKERSIAVIGLGYVGLPLAVELANHYSVIGYDIAQQKIDELNTHIDTNNEVSKEALSKSNITFTTDPKHLSLASFIIVTVPTPIDSNKTPDLRPLKSASMLIGTHLTKDSIVVYESTVYPGATEEICLPLLEQASGLIGGKDFKIGYSPERMNPGDKDHTVSQIIKVVSGQDTESLRIIEAVYSKIIQVGVHPTSSIKVAEAAKVIENTQRDLNIALMNELAIIFNKLDINTNEVLEAAGTKWNFIRMKPGLVGGHCIGVDPYYLTYKSEQIGYHPDVILAGRRINDGMGKYIAEQTVKLLIRENKPVKNASVIILGITFKENVGDYRNTKVIDIYHELREYEINVTIHDPLANSSAVKHEYNINLTEVNQLPSADAIILAVPHDSYIESDFVNNVIQFNTTPLIIDIKGALKNRPDKGYWSL